MIDQFALKTFVDAIAAEYDTEVTPDLIDAAENVLKRLETENWQLVHLTEPVPDSQR